MSQANAAAGGSSDSVELAAVMDELSLEQALLDFEVANARVIDLTQRLIEATATINDYREELDRLRVEFAELRAYQEAMRSSKGFRLAEKIWAVRNAIGV